MIVEKKEQKCELCNKTLSSMTTFQIHLKKVHGKNSKDKECDICKRTFFSKFHMIRHKFLVHEGRQLRCNPCGKEFSQPNKLIAHKEEKGCSQKDNSNA